MSNYNEDNRDLVNLKCAATRTNPRLRLPMVVTWSLFVLLWLTVLGCHSLAPLPSFAPVSPLPIAVSNTPLPAPFYFLGETGQIMRMERDGVTIHQVTDEVMPVTAYDIDPTGVYVVYVTNNDLFRMTVDGAARQLLVSGGPLSEPTDPFTDMLRSVAFAPAGKRLVFAWNGIQLIQDITVGDPATTLVTLLPNGQDANSLPDTMQYFLPDKVFPSIWSPDGQYLLIDSRTPNIEEHGYMLLSVATGRLVSVNWDQLNEAATNGSAGDGICYTGPGISAASWDRATAALYIVNNFMEMFGPPSLSLVSVTQGSVTPLLYTDPTCDPSATAETAQGIRQFRATYSATTGALWAFVTTDFNPEFAYSPPVTMVALDPVTRAIIPLRSDSYFLEDEILWDAQDQGAIVIVHEPSDAALAQFVWLPSDGSPAVELGAAGQLLGWSAPLWGVDSQILRWGQ